MFGQNSGSGSAFGGFNNSNNNNQSSLFGGNSNNSTSPFGATSNNSTASGFGQTSNTFGSASSGGTGLFGQTSNNQQSPGFGGFGNASRPAFGNTTGGFGSSSTTTGSGLFGQSTSNNSSPFGGGGTFGTTNNTTSTSPFGQANSANTSGGLFGSTANKPATTGFGGFGSTPANNAAANTGFGFGSSSTPATNQGTIVPFDPFKEKDPTSNGTNVFQSISCMPVYQKFSFEELREQDYAQGRRFGNNSGSTAFGKPTGFGTGSFGQSSTFGQQSNTATNGGLFGSAANGSSTFGAANSGFGSNNANTASGGLFGQKPATGGLFGSTPNSNSGGLFGNAGSSNNAFGSTATPAFGQANTNSTFGSNSTFGAQNNTQSKPAFGAPTSGFGGFGSAANNTSSTSAFGTTATPTFGSTGSNSTGGLFGANSSATPSFGQPTGTSPNSFGGFGSTTSSQPGQTSAFSFGANNNNNQAKPTFGSGFGSTSAASTLPAFGQQSQQKPAFGFGQPATQQPATNTFGSGTGLFGNPASNTVSNQSGSLFGTASTQNSGGGLFASTPNQQNSTTSTGLFGAKPQTGLFGANQNQAPGSLFGNTSATSGPLGSQQPGSMFSSQPQANNSSLFGSSISGGIGGNPTPLQVNGAQNPYGSNPFFNAQGYNGATPGPIATPISSTAQKKKPALLPTFKLSPKPPSTPRARATPARSLSVSVGSTGSSPNLAKSLLFDGLADKAILSADTFSPRNDIRRLVIDRRVTEAELLSGGSDLGKFKDSSMGEKESTKSVQLPVLSNLPVSALESQDSKAAAESVTQTVRIATPDPTSQPQTKTSTVPSVIESEKVDDNDGYWSSPGYRVLAKMSLKDLSRIENFKVGRKGYGEVTFDGFVDLSEFAHPEQIPGQYVLFGKKTCTVYPDDSTKPSVGKGLNVPGTITLEKCFPISRDTKLPIIEVDHPQIPIHIERLKSIPGTKFITYIAESGTWVFHVDHFSVWGLLDDDDDEPNHNGTANLDYAPVKYPEVPLFSAQPTVSEIFDYSPMKIDVQKVSDPQAHETPDVSNVSMMTGYESSPSPSLPGGWSVQETPLSKVLLNQKSLDIAKSTATYSAPEYAEEEPVSDEEKGYLDTDDELNAQMNRPSRNVSFEYETDDGNVSDGLIDDADLIPFKFKFETGSDWLDQLRFSSHNQSIWSSKDISRGSALDSNPVSFPSSTDSFRFTFADLDKTLFGGLHERSHAGVISPRLENNAPILQDEDNSANSDPLLGLRLLDLNLSHSEIALREEGLPFVSPSKDLTFKDLHSAYSKEDSEMISSIWKLGEILFDNVLVEPGFVNPAADISLATQLIRKSNLSIFLEKLVSASILDDLQKRSENESIFIFLSGHQIEQACIEAVSSNNLHLATLLPLIGGDEEFRRDIRSQIQDWTEKKTLSQIPLSIRKVYELMSGNTAISAGVSGSFNEDVVADICISEGLDWKRAFGLFLWYSVFEEDGLDRAVLSYADAAKSIQGIPRPLSDDIEVERVSQILFGLLMLFSDGNFTIQEAVATSEANRQNIDYSLSWELYIVLCRVKQVRNGFSDNSIIAFGDRLCTDFAKQLEGCGYWKEASFVLLHVSDFAICKRGIQDLLNRHVDEMIEDSLAEKYISSVLHMPKKMILTAKALHARTNQKYLDEVRYLLEADEWIDAHSVVINIVGPKAVISEEYDELLELISRFEDVTHISNWKLGGQIYLDFALVMKARERAGEMDILEFDDPEVSVAAEEEIKMWWPKHIRGLPVQGVGFQDSFERLVNSLGLIDSKSLEFTSMVAIQEIAKVVGVDV
ncbi:nuclear protein 96-domain-containing protein [Lipomyces oligophaga]|uniref:nuclear protein 96-domain-containing protein n=1 Tax=Lipomyces oligophaga TaxID=45792 RepID=UPI0034CE791B